MSKTFPPQPALNGLTAALVERLEEAEAVAIRTFPQTAAASRRHVARLRKVTADAATLAAAIAVLVNNGERR